MQDVSRRVAMGAIVAGGIAAAPVTTSAATNGPDNVVHLQLVLAVDSSASVDLDRFELQRDGYAAAFLDPIIQQAIVGGRNGGIAVCMTHWMGHRDNIVAHDWRRLSDTASCKAFAADIASGTRLLDDGQTSISGAMRFASAQYDRCPFGGVGGRPPPRVIVISRVGPHNEGRYPNEERDATVARSITINGLPILAVESGLDRHYRNFVIGGPGAFMIAAETYDSFADAIRRKLVREIS